MLEAFRHFRHCKWFSFTLAGMMGLLIISLFSCAAAVPDFYRPNCGPKWGTARAAVYPVHMTGVTPQNILLAGGANSTLVDRLTNEVEACLMTLDPILTQEEQRIGGCQAPVLEQKICRECLVAAIAPDWFYTPYSGGQQVLPIVGGRCIKADCDGQQKGYLRVFVQDDYVVVVPPSMYLYKEGLVKITTGCWQPWLLPRLAVCMTPTTGPLDE